MTRLLAATQIVVTIGAAMLAEWLFVRATNALQIDTHGQVLSSAQATVVAAQHHGVTVIAILLGSLVGMMTSIFAAMFATPRALLAEFASAQVFMVAGLAVGLSLSAHRVASLAALVIVLGWSGYARRFGPHGMFSGTLLFIGDFFGFFVGSELQLRDLGWLAAEIGVGVLVAALAQFTVFYPSRRGALRRMRRSYAVRARRVARAAAGMFDEPRNRARASRRLRRGLVQLNEAALIMDAHLGHPGVLPRTYSPAALHQALFDAELSLTNTARFAEALGTADLPADVVALLRQTLAAVSDLDLPQAEVGARELSALARNARAERLGCTSTTQLAAPDAEPAVQDRAILLHRLAVSVLAYTEAIQDWRAEQAHGQGQDADSEGRSTDAFQPAVALFGGWLPGSALVSAAASRETGPVLPLPPTRRGWGPMRVWDRVRLTPSARVAIQMTVAVTAAILLGEAVSGRRFYWAVIAVFVTFMGTNNVGEQLRKGFYRVAGTFVGVLLGALGAHLVGDRTSWAITVILFALFVGTYLTRISYVFMVIAITILVSQLYVQLGEYSTGLLALRLEETVLGAAVATATILCVVPLRTGRVVRVATRLYVQALSEATSAALDRLTSHDPGADLRAALRGLDAAYQTLLASLLPLRVPFAGGDNSTLEHLLQPISAARHYTRNLLGDTRQSPELAEASYVLLEQAGHRLMASLDELVAQLSDARPSRREYVRSADLFGRAATQLPERDYLTPPQLALRDLQLLDGAMATLAEAVGMAVRTLDTSTSGGISSA